MEGNEEITHKYLLSSHFVVKRLSSYHVEQNFSIFMVMCVRVCVHEK